MAARLADTEPPAAVLWAVKRNHDLNAWRPDLKYLEAWNESGECFSYVMWMGVPSRMMWMGGPSRVISCPVDTCILCGCACFTRSPRDQGFPFEQGILRASSHHSGVKLEYGLLGTSAAGRANAKPFFILKKPTHPKRLFHSEEKPNLSRLEGRTCATSTSTSTSSTWPGTSSGAPAPSDAS